MYPYDGDSARIKISVPLCDMMSDGNESDVGNIDI